MGRFLGDPLKTPKNIFPTKAIMGYKMVPISILQMQMSKIFLFFITVQIKSLSGKLVSYLIFALEKVAAAV